MTISQKLNHDLLWSLLLLGGVLLFLQVGRQASREKPGENLVKRESVWTTCTNCPTVWLSHSGRERGRLPSPPGPRPARRRGQEGAGEEELVGGHRLPVTPEVHQVAGVEAGEEGGGEAGPPLGG